MAARGDLSICTMCKIKLQISVYELLEFYNDNPNLPAKVNSIEVKKGHSF